MQLSLKSANFFEILLCFILVWGLWQGISYSRISCKWFIASSKGQYLAVNVVILSMIWQWYCSVTIQLYVNCQEFPLTCNRESKQQRQQWQWERQKCNKFNKPKKTLQVHYAFYVKLPNFMFYGRCWHEAKFWFVLLVSKYFLTCARQGDLLNHSCISLIKKLRNRRHNEDMKILSHHPSIGYFLEHYFMIFRENVPSEMKPGKCSAKRLTKRGWKVKTSRKEKKQKLVKNRGASVSFKPNILKFCPSPPPPNFRRCSLAPGTDWSQNSFLIVFFTFGSFCQEVTRNQLHLFSGLVLTIYYFDQNFQNQMHSLMSIFFSQVKH